MIMIMMMMVMIGLESNVAYNDHELPSQLSPDQYFKLEWALSEDRQELAHEENKDGDTLRSTSRPLFSFKAAICTCGLRLLVPLGPDFSLMLSRPCD